MNHNQSLHTYSWLETGYWDSWRSRQLEVQTVRYPDTQNTGILGYLIYYLELNEKSNCLSQNAFLMSTGSPQVILIRCSYLSYPISITLVAYDQQKRAVHTHSKFIDIVVFYYFLFSGVIRCYMNIIYQTLILFQSIPVGLLQKYLKK